METITIDPALKRLLDNLPKGDPDAQEPDQAEVWIAFCDRVQTVPVGVARSIDFGKWQGPDFPTVDIVIHAKNLRTSKETSVRVGDLSWNGPSVIQRGAAVTANALTITV